MAEDWVRLLKETAALALADGELADRERALLEKYAGDLGLDADRLDAIIAEARHGGFENHLPEDPERRPEYLRMLADLALCDGSVNDKERRLLEEVVRRMGAPPETLDGLLPSPEPSAEAVAGVRCIGCGRSVDPATERCSDCNTRVRGARYTDYVDFGKGQNYIAPPVCACCMGATGSSTTTEMTTRQEAGIGYVYREFSSISIPHCWGCWRRRLFWKALTVGVLVGTVAIALGAALANRSGAKTSVAILLGGLAAALVLTVLAQKFAYVVVPALRRPGHVRHCDAFESGRGLWIAFHNYAFATRWRELNNLPRKD